ncbi:MAG TPA: thioredoxin family protein [Candidatus Hypogeohydataceae bacterium YC41]
MADRLIEFYGTECVHCKKMDPLIERLEREQGVKITRLEVWHNSQNAALMENVDRDEKGLPFCGGIPFFYNEKTGKKICGETTYEELKKWALGK